MRNPKRIKRMLKLIDQIWQKYPDQRLGQLLANYCFGHHNDIFYQEDDVSENTLISAKNEMQRLS